MDQASNKQSKNTQIGRYLLDVKLGEGASGVVYRAYDPVMDRDVAIKSAKAEALTEEQIKEVIDEFHYEAKIAGKYAHENIVTIYDVISHGKLDHIVMEYVPGRSIQDYMKATGPLDLDEALSVVYKCCVGLSYIHYHGVIHRDIKPGNIMYHPAQGVAKLMDFSVAHNIEEPPVRDTGTIAYMAPEHFDPDRRISLLTDIFAMGSTMYRMFSGKYPFTSNDTAHQILNEDPVPITQLRPDIPEDVANIINKAIAKTDAERFQTAADFAEAIEEVCKRIYPNSDMLDTSNKYMSRS
ncbi:MAG: protein kinase [Gammaproteobacteria bacterium]|nr:protein kinase [Gammaproteobacteria bacterium]